MSRAAGGQRKVDDGGLTRVEVYLGEGFQLADRPGDRGLAVPDVELDDLLPAAVAGIGYLAGDRHDEVAVLVAPGDSGGEVGIGEARIRQAVPERVADRTAERVVAAIADEDALAVADVPGLPGEVEVGRVVLQP